MRLLPPAYAGKVKFELHCATIVAKYIHYVKGIMKKISVSKEHTSA